MTAYEELDALLLERGHSSTSQVVVIPDELWNRLAREMRDKDPFSGRDHPVPGEGRPSMILWFGEWTALYPKSRVGVYC